MPDFCSIINVKLPERPEIERNERYKQMEESMKDYEKELEASFRTIKEGDVVKGTVIDVNEEEVHRRPITLRISCSAAPVLLVTTPMHFG